MKFRHIFLLLFIAILPYSCQNEDLVPTSETLVNQGQPDASDSILITSKTATKVAQLFRGNSNPQLKSSPIPIKEILTVSNEDGTPAMYIMNYDNNNGFVIVSATKNYYPVLAHSDKGNFPLNNMPLGAEQWIGESKYTIARQIKEQCIDSLLLFRKLWKPYQEQPKAEVKSVKNLKSSQEEEFNSAIGRVMSEFNAQGISYQYYSYGMGEPLIDNHLNDYPSCAFITSQWETWKQVKGPHLKDKAMWDQLSPYNKYTHIVRGEQTPTGCVAVAMTQVMKYHRHPKNFNWDIMAESYSSSIQIGADDVAKLMRTAGDMVGMDYRPVSEGGSGAPTKNIVNALQLLGYSSKMDYKNYDVAAVLGEAAIRPVIVSGGNSKGERHAWIIDGTESIFYRETKKITIINGLYSPVEVYSFDLPGDYAVYSSIHMNLGWGGYYNGWYTAHTTGVQQNDKLYLNDRYMIVNIYPK